MDKFWAKVVKTPSCWLWVGSINARGSGRILLNGKRETAARISFQLHYGSLSPKKTIRLKCGNKRCVNPEHLEELSYLERAKYSKSLAAINALKTNCSRGHAFTKENTYFYREGRQCKACFKSRKQLAKQAA